MKHITTVILLINGLLLSSAVQGQNQQNGSKKRQFGAPNSVRNQGQTKGQQNRKTVRQPLGSNNQQGQGKKPKHKSQGQQTGMTKAKKGESIVKALKLDKEQAQKLRAAHQSMVATHKGLRGNKDLSDEEKKQAHHNAHKKHLEGLAEFLSKEQLATLKEIHRKNAKPQQNNKKPKPGERLAKALGLSKEQVSKLRQLREFAIKKIGGILKKSENQQGLKARQIKEVHVTFRARRNEILTEEQQAILKELHAAAKARREEQAAKSGKESSGCPRKKRAQKENEQQGEKKSQNGNQAFGRQQNQQQGRPQQGGNQEQGRPQRRPQQGGNQEQGRPQRRPQQGGNQEQGRPQRRPQTQNR